MHKVWFLRISYTIVLPFLLLCSIFPAPGLRPGTSMLPSPFGRRLPKQPPASSEASPPRLTCIKAVTTELLTASYQQAINQIKGESLKPGMDYLHGHLAWNLFVNALPIFPLYQGSKKIHLFSTKSKQNSMLLVIYPQLIIIWTDI